MLRTLEGHDAGIDVLAAFSRKHLLASVSLDGTIKLWSLPKGELTNTLPGPTGMACGLATTPDGKVLASANVDGRVVFMSPPAWKPIKTLQTGFRSTAFVIAPDGKMLALAGSDGRITLWSVPGGKPIKTLAGHEGSVSALAFTGGTLISGGTDGSIKLWSLSDGEMIRKLEGHAEAVSALAITPDGRLLASGDRGGVIKLWSLPDGRVTNTLLGAVVSAKPAGGSEEPPPAAEPPEVPPSDEPPEQPSDEAPAEPDHDSGGSYGGGTFTTGIRIDGLPTVIVSK
jgi:WD40 repeat protein